MHRLLGLVLGLAWAALTFAPVRAEPAPSRPATDTDLGVGLSLGYQLDYAPLIDNVMGQTYASGGHRLAAGVSYA